MNLLSSKLLELLSRRLASPRNGGSGEAAEVIIGRRYDFCITTYELANIFFGSESGAPNCAEVGSPTAACHGEGGVLPGGRFDGRGLSLSIVCGVLPTGGVAGPGNLAYKPIGRSGGAGRPVGATGVGMPPTGRA